MKENPTYGQKGETPSYCGKCKEDGMIHLYFKLCECDKRTTFGYEKDGKAICCKTCKKDGMVDLRNKKCPCGNIPKFGFKDDKKPSCCKTCKKDGMIDIKKNANVEKDNQRMEMKVINDLLAVVYVKKKI